MKSTFRILLGAGVIAAFAATSAFAQAPVRVRGTIESIDNAGIITVKGRDGQMMKVMLPEKAPVRAVVKMTIADIQKGSFIGITAMPQPDGSQKAVEIHIFPEAMRGTGEGHRPWDLMPNSTMTNATVDSEVASNDGQVLMMKYKDGEKKIIVPPPPRSLPMLRRQGRTSFRAPRCSSPTRRSCPTASSRRRISRSARVA